MNISRHRYLLILALLFCAEWIVLAIDPLYRKDWALENELVVVFVVALAGSYKSLPLSRVSYTLIFVFLCLHEIGEGRIHLRLPKNRAPILSAMRDIEAHLERTEGLEHWFIKIVTQPQVG